MLRWAVRAEGEVNGAEIDGHGEQHEDDRGPEFPVVMDALPIGFVVRGVVLVFGVRVALFWFFHFAPDSQYTGMGWESMVEKAG